MSTPVGAVQEPKTNGGAQAYGTTDEDEEPAIMEVEESETRPLRPQTARAATAAPRRQPTRRRRM